MPAGTSQVRLVPNWEAGRPAPEFSVVVASAGPRFLWVFLAWVLLLALPVLRYVRHAMFESARWAESSTGYAR
jgi:hypothetical protein